MRKILLLSNHLINRKFDIYQKINNKAFSLFYTENKINLNDTKHFDFIISYGYRYIIKKDIINYFNNNIINCHISYLPYNRGSDPNLWSILDNTPSGITIHKLSYKLDKGDIIYQKKINFKHNETLDSSYNLLNNETIDLLNNNIENLINGNFESVKQNENLSTYHELKDRPDFNQICPQGWNTQIKTIKKLYSKYYL